VVVEAELGFFKKIWNATPTYERIKSRYLSKRRRSIEWNSRPMVIQNARRN
jgi:hypothetical protein